MKTWVSECFEYSIKNSDSEQKPGVRKLDMRNRWIGITGVLSIAAIVSLYIASKSYFNAIEVQQAKNRATLYRSTLVNALEQFQHLPFVLAHDSFVIKAAAGEGRNMLNVRFESFAKRAGLEAIYLLDLSGQTVSASNHNAAVTFLGENYSFRPYFKQAIAGQRGKFFGIGATTARPGYFLAELVRDGRTQALGVVAIKLDLTKLQKAWSAGGETVFVSNKDGIIILSSNPSWLYQTMTPIENRLRRKIALERQFSGQPLKPLGWQKRRADRVLFEDKAYVHVASKLKQQGWTLHYLADEGRVRERALFTVIIGGTALSLLLTAFAFIRSKRIHHALKASQKDRRSLKASNLKLEKAQSALAQASKMAALGQLSASVTHELGQPLSALRNYLTAAEFEEGTPVRHHTLERMGAIVKRMENITKQLRFFARPGEIQTEQLDLRRVLEGARQMVAHDLDAHEITLLIDVPENPLNIVGNRLRLEQVVVNLVNNAMTAMEGTNEREITIVITATHEKAILIVEDCGHGLGERSIEQLQEPFHTTRASGHGMGLGLAISASIVSEHNGILSASDQETGGARFTVELPRIPPVKEL